MGDSLLSKLTQGRHAFTQQYGQTIFPEYESTNQVMRCEAQLTIRAKGTELKASPYQLKAQ